MPLGTPSLAAPTALAAAATVTSDNFTPTGSALLIAFAAGRATVVPGNPTISDSQSLTWVPLVDGLYDSGSGTRVRARAWATVLGGSPSSMAVTAASTGSGRMALGLVQITGHNGVPFNAAATDDASGDPTVVLGSAPDASSCVLAFLGAANTVATVTPPTGFTELDDVTDGGGIALHCCYDPTAPLATVAYTTNGNASVGIAIEIAEAVRRARVPLRRHLSFQHMMIR